MPQLRPAHHADVPEILRIQAQCYTEIEPETADAYLNKLEQAPDCAFVIEDASCKQVLAYLFALPIQIEAPPELDAQDFVCPATANCLYLHDLAIAPNARGLGLSRPLMQAFFAAAQARRLPWASLIAIQDSQAFWQAYGFASSELSLRADLQNKLRSYGAASYLLQKLSVSAA